MQDDPQTDTKNERQAAIRVRDLVVAFGESNVLDHLSLDVVTGEILGLVGGSGSGKSVLMRTIIGLLPKRQGSIEVLGVDLDKATGAELRAMERRWGVLFQHGALFSSLSVRENVKFPMRQYLDLSPALMDEIALAKLEMVGLKTRDGDKLPSELSGGMTKRAALARALALDPEIVFLDEPTSGLDPIAAGDFDMLIRTLQRTLGLTVFMVTHDLEEPRHGLRSRGRAGGGQGRCRRTARERAGLCASVGKIVLPGPSRPLASQLAQPAI